jgi:uncharacterized protein HemY
MKRVSSLAVAVALAIGAAGGVAVTGQHAEAQESKAPKLKLSKDVQKSLAEAQKLQEAGDLAGAIAQVRVAEAASSSADDKYMSNAIKINLALAQKDNALLEEALEGALASGKVPAEEQPKFLRNLGALALQRNDYTKAAQQYERLIAANPNDTESMAALSEIYYRNRQAPQAIATLKKAIETAKASGQPAQENWYKRLLALAYDGKVQGEIGPAAEALVSAYPTATNWRDALVIYRDTTTLDDQGNLDVMRLMRTVGALTGERDYVEYAETAVRRGLPGEAKAVLDEGVSKGMLQNSKPYMKDLRGVVDPKVAEDKASLASLAKEAQGAKDGKLALSTGDGYLSHGMYDKAAEMYRLALQKGGIDQATANTRLGISLAKLGNKAEAETAFKAIQASPRQQLADYWLIWLDKQSA